MSERLGRPLRRRHSHVFAQLGELRAQDRYFALESGEALGLGGVH